MSRIGCDKNMPLMVRRSLVQKPAIPADSIGNCRTEKIFVQIDIRSHFIRFCRVNLHDMRAAEQKNRLGILVKTRPMRTIQSFD